MKRKLDKVKLRARLHWAEQGPVHLCYCLIVAMEGHVLLTLTAGAMAVLISACMILGGGDA